MLLDHMIPEEGGGGVRNHPGSSDERKHDVCWKLVMDRWCSDRSAYMTAGPSNVLFQWVIGSCVTMHQQRSVNWIRHGLAHI